MSEHRVHFELAQRGRLRFSFFSLSVNDMLPPAAHLALNLCLHAATVTSYYRGPASLQTHIVFKHTHIFHIHTHVGHFPSPHAVSLSAEWLCEIGQRLSLFNLSHTHICAYLIRCQMKLKPTCMCHVRNRNKLTALLCVIQVFFCNL